MASAIDIVVKVIDQASKKLQDISKSTDQLGKDSKSTGISLAGLGKVALGVTATVAAFGVAAKAAFEMGKQGAAIKQTGESFEFLLSKIGAAPDLLDQLRTASRGTISDMALMSSTATLLAGAQGELGTQLAKATPQLLNIAKAAQKLNPSLGDTTFLYNSLAVGIKRGSPLILDNLGLLVSQGDANKALAIELGKTVQALTTEEMKLALLNETIRAGNVLVAQAGGTTKSATDAYGFLEAGITNLTDAFKTNVHDAVLPWVDAAGKAVDTTLEWVKSMEVSNHELAVQAEMVRMGIDPMLAYHSSMLDGIDVLTEYQKMLAELRVQAQMGIINLDLQQQEADGWRQGTEIIKENHVAILELYNAKRDTEQMELDIAVARGEGATALETQTALQTELTLAVGVAKDEYGILSDEYQRALAVLRLVTEAIEGTTQATVDLSNANGELLASQLELAASADKAMLGFQNSIRELNSLKNETLTAAEASAEFQRVQDSVDIAMGRTNQMIVDQRDKVERLRNEWEDSNFTNKELEHQLEVNIKFLEIYTNGFRNNTGVVHTNTRAIADNTAINEANRELRDAVAVATGRQTQAMVTLRLEQEHWSEIYRNSVGPAREHALNMVLATAIALQNETQAHRINTSAVSAATSQQLAYNQALTGSGTGAGGFTGSISGDVAGGLGLKSMEEMRKELGVAAGTDYWEGASERDVMAEYYKLTQQAAKREPDWDAFYDAINKDRAERGEDPITVMDVSPTDKAQQLRDQLEGGTYGAGPLKGQPIGSIMRINDQGEEELADWAQPLFDAIADPDSPTGFFQGFRHGGNFTVPAGFNNDNFMMGVSSGERVSVTPAHMNSGAGGLIINNINIYGVQTSSELYEAIIQQARMRGKNFAKVL